MTEYLFRKPALLDEVINTAIEDNTFRSDDLEFSFAARVSPLDRHVSFQTSTICLYPLAARSCFEFNHLRDGLAVVSEFLAAVESVLFCK